MGEEIPTQTQPGPLKHPSAPLFKGIKNVSIQNPLIFEKILEFFSFFLSFFFCWCSGNFAPKAHEFYV